MPEPANRRTHAALQAYNWARVASNLRLTRREWEEARELSNAGPGSGTEWHRWLLDHLDAQIDLRQALELAEMWTKVAAVQPDDS
ncbi:hypothetical protein [Streptomyces natalensis]|uniref:Uncharacterized protein n=1 Tax=Streptomyces natalensis ATCC 27448 TaxID=1240678 RepID=A0A0D7CMG9_9ACTN|nr:hypothetical protein [Streptomyces natalensis]KIZ17378.1 hypothetical protein SNA_12750 [Streptomyces natalensis ATCC 27448]